MPSVGSLRVRSNRPSLSWHTIVQATLCKTQGASVAELSKGGDGCDESLTWWVTTYLEELRNPPKRAKPTGPRPRTAREFIMSDLPKQCATVLASD